MARKSKRTWPDHTTVSQDQQFAALTRWLPNGWEEKAEEFGAFTRARKIRSVASLLRIVLAYVILHKSLPELSRWAAQQQLATMKVPSLWKRLILCLPYLRWLVAELTRGLVADLPPGLLWCPVDGTTFTVPASNKRDWLALVLWSHGQPVGVRVTKLRGKNTGESLRHLDFLPHNAVAIGDRVYGTPPGIAAMRKRERLFLCRFVWNNLPLFATADGEQPLDPRPLVKGLAPGEMHEIAAFVRPEAGEPIPVRVVLVAKTPERAAAARRASERESRRKHHQPDPLNLFLTGYITLVTNLLPTQADARVLADAYRWRWQIELEFKRLKGISGVRKLPNQKDETAEFYILALLATWLLCYRLVQRNVFFPWGCPLGPAGGTGPTQPQGVAA